MTTINIERLTSPTIIYRTDTDAFGPFGACAEVQDIRFDGEAYQITARMLEGHDDHVSDTEVEFTVWAGESIAYGGRGAPKLRGEADVTLEEWEAKRDAIDADCLRLQGMLNDIQGYEAQPVDEARRAQFYGAVAQALGVDSLVAAE